MTSACTARAAIVAQQWRKDHPLTDPEQNVASEKPTFTRESALKLAASGVLAVASYLAADRLPPFVFYLAYIVVLIAVAYNDLRERRIPNRIIYPAILVALGAMFYHFPDWGRFPGWGIALLGGVAAALVFTVPVFIYGPDRAGIGDVKLAFFIGLIFGFSVPLLWALLIGSGSAALVGLVGILLRKMGRKSLLPFGSFLALGAIARLIAQMVR
ncbi:MAG: A24 family peptidase [Anaerolineae bacterium]|nr:A24 family peptidase [Anaerolineae bacterium]